MKQSKIALPEFFYSLTFLLYLGGSSLAHIQNGVELSLWLMAFAMVISFATTTLPWLGFRWLKLRPQGSRVGRGVSLFLQVCSWGTYGLAMFLRLNRDLALFQTLITVTTLLWAAWLLIFIYNRYACPSQNSGDKLNPENRTDLLTDEKREDL